LQIGEIVGGGSEQNVPIHTKIIMDKNVSHAGDLSPGDFGMGVTGGRTDAERGLADDLHVAQNMGLEERIGIECRAIGRQMASDLGDGVEDVLKIEPIRPPSGIASFDTI
jgi:hypothetical protein